MDKFYRQGELVFKPIKTAIQSYGASYKLSTKTIREGEVTGHKHEITSGTLYQVGNTLYLSADENTQVTHPEHKAIHIEKGDYEIYIQREYDEGRERQIAD